jgi:hypothetical protein
MRDFQVVREELTRAAFELCESPPSPEDPHQYAAWENACAAINRQIEIMDGTARGILAASDIAHGIGEFFPGFEGVSVAGALGLAGIAAPISVTALTFVTHNAQAALNRAHAALGRSAPPSNGLGQYAPWGRIGGDVWEWIHAGQVREEYEAVGRTAPTIEEIREGALTDIGERVSEGAGEIFSGAKTVMIAAAVIAVAVFVAPRVLGRVK